MPSAVIRAATWARSSGSPLEAVYCRFLALFPTISESTPQTMIDWTLFFGMPIFFIILFALICVIVGPSMHEKKFTLRYVKDTFIYFWFGLTWIPILFKPAFLAADQSTWVKTEHTRSISLDDVSKSK